MKVAKVQRYRVIIEKDEDGFFVATVPALPGCVTQAKTYETLMERIQEAIELCLEVAADDKLYRAQQKVFSYEPVFIGIEDIAVRV
jgi:predicted RNase H-like HicB family nuclease